VHHCSIKSSIACLNNNRIEKNDKLRRTHIERKWSFRRAMIVEKKKSLARNARVEGNREGLLGEWKQIKNKKKERTQTAFRMGRGMEYRSYAARFEEGIASK